MWGAAKYELRIDQTRRGSLREDWTSGQADPDSQETIFKMYMYIVQLLVHDFSRCDTSLYILSLKKRERETLWKSCENNVCATWKSRNSLFHVNLLVDERERRKC